MSVTIVEPTPNQIVCRLFYKKSKDSDVTVYALEESDYGTISYDGKKYSYVVDLPTDDHNYSQKYTCQNGSVVTYTVETGIKVASTGPDVCYIYFNNK